MTETYDDVSGGVTHFQGVLRTTWEAGRIEGCSTGGRVRIVGP